MSSFAQGPFAPAANQAGTTAIHKDSSIFVGWASSAVIHRGFQNILDTNSGKTTVGSDTNVFGIADGKVLSLGDGGTATVQFVGRLYNGIGPDFAVFENAFNNTFLELAFVEVSSNGVDFVRFPNQSLTDTVTPVGSFGAIDPTNVNNLAGKYQVNYGTPFDLEDLRNTPNLDLNNIGWVRIIDVVGTLNDSLTRRDSQGRKINDQFPTEFPSGGFDLDAIGVIYLNTVGLYESEISDVPTFYPNPVNEKVTFSDSKWSNFDYQLFGLDGKLLEEGILVNKSIVFKNNYTGVKILNIGNNYSQTSIKLVFK